MLKGFMHSKSGISGPGQDQAGFQYILFINLKLDLDIVRLYVGICDEGRSGQMVRYTGGRAWPFRRHI